MYRVKDPVKGDDSSLYDDGVLDADIATTQVGTAFRASFTQLVAVQALRPSSAARCTDAVLFTA